MIIEELEAITLYKWEFNGEAQEVKISTAEYLKAKKIEKVVTIRKKRTEQVDIRIKDKEKELEDLINFLIEENDKNVKKELVDSLLIKKEQLVRLEIALESNDNNQFIAQIQTSLQN